MQAHTGDWLIVHGHTDGAPVRRAEILATRADGGPPFTVRWTENDHEAVVFPGPDAQIVTAADMANLDRPETAQARRPGG